MVGLVVLCIFLLLQGFETDATEIANTVDEIYSGNTPLLGWGHIPLCDEESRQAFAPSLGSFPKSGCWDLNVVKPADRVPIPRVRADELTANSIMENYLSRDIPVILTGLNISPDTLKTLSAVASKEDSHEVLRSGNPFHENFADNLLSGDLDTGLPFRNAVTWELQRIWGQDTGMHVPHVDVDQLSCNMYVDFSVQLSGQKIWMIQTYHNSSAAEAPLLKRHFGFSYISDRVFVGILQPGEVLLFVRSWQPHAVHYFEPDTYSAHGKVDFRSEGSRLFDLDAMRRRCGDHPQGCIIKAELQSCAASVHGMSHEEL